MAILAFSSNNIFDSTSAGRALLTAADASAQRTLLGVGTGDSPTFSNVTVTGRFFASDGTRTVPSISFTNYTGTGLSATASTVLDFAVGGNHVARLSNGGAFAVLGTGAIGFANGATDNAPDTLLFRDAANTLAQRNGTNAQIFRAYNTYTNASNYERGILGWDTNVLKIGTENAGTGSARNIQLIHGGSERLRVQSSVILATDFQPFSNSYKLGSNSLRWGAVFGGRTLSGSDSESFIDFDGIWNTTGTPAAIKLNVTDTASNAASLLMDLQTGATSRFKIEKTGNLTIGTGGTTLTFSGNNDSSYNFSNGSARVRINASLAVSVFPALELSRNAGGTYDTSLRSEEAGGIIAQRNDLNPQVFRIYNTYTDVSNYERGKFAWSSNVLQIGTEKLGTGVARALELQTDGTTRITIGSTGNVGIGTTSPVARLDIAGTADSVQLRVKAHTTQTNNIQEWWAASAALYTAAITPSCGFFTRAATAFEVSNGRSFQLTADSNTFNIRDGSAGVTRVTIGSTGNVGINNTSPTVRLDVAGTVEVKDGLNPQTLAVYNTYSGAGANYERGFIRWNNNFFEFGADALGTGNNRAVRFLTSGFVRMTVSSTVPEVTLGNDSGAPGIFSFTGASYTVQTNGRGLCLYTRTTTTANDIGIALAGEGITATSGASNIHTIIHRSFVPTSGTGTFQLLRLAPTINQTGGANGASRGIVIAPSLTAAADWAALESTNGTFIIGDTYASGSGSLAGSLLNLSQTWNTTGTPTAINLNVTDTQSNAASLLMRMQVGGTTRFSVAKTGATSITTNNNLTVLTLQNSGNTVNSGYEILVGSPGNYDGYLMVRRVGQATPGDFYLPNGGPPVFTNGVSVGDNSTFSSSSSQYLAYYSPYCPSGGHGGNTGELLFRNLSGAGVFEFGGYYHDGVSYSNIRNILTLRLGTSTDGRVGIGTRTPSGKLGIVDTVLSGSGSLATSALDIAQTWNTTGTPNAISLNVTDTASNANSLLFRLQTGGVTQFSVRKDGRLNLKNNAWIDQNGSAFLTSLCINNGVADFGAVYLANTIQIKSTFAYAWNSADANTSSVDLFLYRDAANTLAQRNGVNAQAFRLYNTFTDASNYERAFIQWNSNVLQIGNEKLGTGAARILQFLTDGTSRLQIGATGDFHMGTAGTNTLRFYNQISGAGSYEANTNGIAFDCRVRSGTAGSSAFWVYWGNDCTSNIHSLVRFSGGFTPTSGNASHTTLLINPAINQTGGANGITRGLYINPTLTSAADWRAIEVTAGKTIVAPSTTTSASLNIPSGTAPTSPVDGDIWFDGTNLKIRVGGVTKTIFLAEDANLYLRP